MTSNLVVSKSSILIHLSRIGKLWPSKKIFGKVIVPKAVYGKCMIGDMVGSEEINRSEWINC